MKRHGSVVFARDLPGDYVSVSIDLLPVGVVFFPSLPFMGVVLSPSFLQGDASGEGGTFLVSLSLFSPLLSSFFSFSFILSSFLSPFLPHLILPFSFPFAFLFLSFPLSFFLYSFFFSSFPSLFPFLFLSRGFFFFLYLFIYLFLRELLVLFVSEMKGMTLLIVINCTFIVIKRCFIF